MIPQEKNIEIRVVLCVLVFGNELLKLMIMNIMIMPLLNWKEIPSLEDS